MTYTTCSEISPVQFMKNNRMNCLCPQPAASPLSLRGGWRRRRTLTVRSRWSHYRATHSCIMHPTKLLFAGDCHLSGIRAAIADAFSIHARHCTSLMASLRFFSARTTKKRELFARILLGVAPWVNNAPRPNRNAMVSVNRCTRYIAPTRREGTSAILKCQRIPTVQDAVDTKDSRDWCLLQTETFYCWWWQFTIVRQKS